MNLPKKSDSFSSMTNKWPALLILALFSFSALAGGVVFYKSQKNAIFQDKQDELKAISSLKIDDLSKWRSEHLRDVRILSNNTALRNMILDYLEGNGSENSLSNVFQPLTENYDYQSIFIVDTDNVKRFSTTGNKENNIDEKELCTSVATLDLYFSNDSSDIFMDMAVDIPDPEGKSAGKLILRVDPEITLFPLIQSWPTSSKTSETLLIRKDGDSIVYLNDLKHIENAALKLKLATSDIELPAARVVNGYEGLFEGLDYRGVPVVSYLRKVPDSPWYMVAKVDKAEIYAPLNEQIILISLLVILSITTFSIITGFHFRNQRIRYLNEISKTRDKLYSIISHDLKNPFVSIMGFSELLYEKALVNDFSRTKEFTGIIYNSSTNAVELLNNLTSWTKLQTGRTLFNPRETDLVQLMTEVADSCKASALMKSITIKISATDGLFVTIDRVMFATILRNLVINAIKFSYHYSEIFVTAGKNDEIVEVLVADSGIGIDSHIIDKILKMGMYESTPGTANEKGTGLGLFLCMEFIAMHNGTLNIESEPGKGSRFRVKLPMQ